MIKYSGSLFTIIFCTFGYWVQAQENPIVPPMVTDRPDQTESPTLVPKGAIQIETGSFYEENESDNILLKSTTYNTTLFRIGLLSNFELRIGGDFTEIETEINGNKLEDIQSGLSPLLLGAKIGVSAEKGWLPEIGFIGHINLPFTAGSDYRPETTGVDFRFSFAHTLNEKSGISYNLGAAWGDDSPEASYVYTLVYGYALTNRLGLYAELYGELPEDSSPNHKWDAGLTYALQSNFQLDFTIGSGISEGQNLLISGGFSYRILN